ncbi:unnamed protein product [Pylaiella littoralis]
MTSSLNFIPFVSRPHVLASVCCWCLSQTLAATIKSCTSKSLFCVCAFVVVVVRGRRRSVMDTLTPLCFCATSRSALAHRSRRKVYGRCRKRIACPHCYNSLCSISLSCLSNILSGIYVFIFGTPV